MKQKLPRWFLAAAWARVAPCAAAVLASAFSLLALAALVLAPARFVGAGFFSPAAAALSFVVARLRRQRFGLPNGLGPPTTLYLPEPAH